MKRLGSIVMTISILVAGLAMPAWAAEPVTPRVITLEEAQAMALKSNYGINIKEKTLIRTEEGRTQASETADALRGSVGDSSAADSYAKAAVVGLISQTNNVAIVERQIELEKESLALAVRSQFDSVRKTKGQLGVVNKKLIYDQRQLSLSNLRMLYGLESEFNADKAQDEYKQQVAMKSQLEKSLETAFVKLNGLIGLQSSDRYDVAYAVPLEILEETGPSYSPGSDPYLWILDKQKETDEVRLKLYTLSDSILARDESYKGREAKKAITNQVYLETRDKLAEAVKERFYQIKQLEDELGSLEIKVRRAQKNLEMAQLQYKVGMGIAIDVMGAELALASAQQEYDAALVNHATLLIIYKKPYLMPDYLSSDYASALGG